MPAQAGAVSVRRLATRAPAKVNLTLTVLARRPDGYHELDSLVAFAGTGDDLTLEPGDSLDLVVEGPSAGATGPRDGNLIIKAARALDQRRVGLKSGMFRLIKRLPAAAGLGGGSSDAAAALRLLARLNGLSLQDSAIVEAARATGADVPVCLVPRMRMMRGVGDVLGPPLAGAGLFAVLVNPGQPVETARVFGRLGLQPGEQHRERTRPFDDGATTVQLSDIAAADNDLEPAAIAVAPVVAEALDSLRALPGCRLARMSGSGATVFGLFGDRHEAAVAGRTLARQRRGWWVRATGLR